jgi:tetratricopeptide (TPR) repeat protein
MEQHPSPATLARFVSGQAASSEDVATRSHLVHCKPCWDRAHEILAELERTREEEERAALSRMCAHARWTELASLAPEQQIGRIKAEADLRTREMFDTVIEAASAAAPNDPFLGEETARVAYALAGRLSKDVCSEADRNDLQSEALGTVGTSRRLAADWRGSAEAFKEARRHLACGTGDPVREARLLSIQASLATDIGHVEQAETSLSRAAAIYRKVGNPAALAAVTVQEAGAFLAACQHEQAIGRAEEALSLLTPKDTRLEMLARNIITASLVFLGRPAAALKSYTATRPLYEHIPERRNDLQAGYVEALLLDSLGSAREAERAFRRNIARRMDAELYKDAFLTMLTRFELLFRRGAMDKAAQACEEAIEAMREAEVPCQEQMEGLWSGLLDLVKARKLSENQLVTARLYLVRHWNAPAPWSPLEVAGGNTGAAEQLLTQRGVVVLAESTNGDGLPSPAAGTAGDSYYEASLEGYDRALIMTGLAQCGGRFKETARLLRIAAGTLRAKMKRYGLAAGVSQDSSAEAAAGADFNRLDEEGRRALVRLRAGEWWRDLQPLSTAEQLARIKSSRTLQTRELVDTILEEAAKSALSDPRRGEEEATLAYALAGILPPSRCPAPVKHDLQGAALGVKANCRRLAGDWQGSAASFGNAGSHLGRGTGDPAREARLLSLRASLATDMGHYEDALSLLARAAVLYRGIRDAAGAAFTVVQEAGTLLAAGRHSEAAGRAEEALRLLAPSQIPLAILARNIITSSLVYLGRPAEALRSFQATVPLARQAGGAHTELQASYLEALVLDALGFEREADAAFNANISTRMEAGLYKDAFLTLLTRFAILFKRGEVAKATRVCEEAIERMKAAGEDRHAQTIQLWRDLLALVDARRLTDLHLLETRNALVRCWASPAQPATAPAAVSQPVELPGTVPEDRQDRRLLAAAKRPPLPARLVPGDYQLAMALYDRQIIAEGLARCEGNVAETSRTIGIPRTTLRAKMSKYGLKEEAAPGAKPR